MMDFLSLKMHRTKEVRLKNALDRFIRALQQIHDTWKFEVL